MKLMLKVIAYIAALPVAVVATAVGIGVYQGITQVAAVEANVGLFEAYLEDYGRCGEYTSESDWNADGNCAIICDSYFECRNDYLKLEQAVDNEWAKLHEDTYTFEEYEEEYGSIEYSHVATNPGKPPQPAVP